MLVSDISQSYMSFVQFECCGTINFTDWKVARLTPPDDDDGDVSNGSSSSSSVHSNGSWLLSVPDSCCVDVLEQVGCGWAVITETESKLNSIHAEAS